jgi:hypothetical protein|tara:strand:- start:51 stop:1292 length:1242 start_codon:yes stop_codon:yes gene_type:complete
MVQRINQKLIDAQNKWAQEHPDNPYRTAELDTDLWKTLASENYEQAETVCRTNSSNLKNGLNWDQHYTSWSQFCADENNVWPIEKFAKDLNNQKRPQRPFDCQHLVSDIINQHDGEFNHALAGPIDVAIRPDGSINVWDHWHTVLFAYMSGISHLRVNVIRHPSQLTLEDCRAVECGLYHSKNGLSKKSTTEDVYEKTVVVDRYKGKTAKDSPNIATDNIFQELCLSPTNKNTGFRGINGVGVINSSRSALIKEHGVAEADKKIESYLKLIRDSFPTGLISGYFYLGINNFMNKFEDRFTELNVKSLSTMFSELAPSGYTADKFISTSDNKKGLPAESISMRIAHTWSTWMKDSKRTSRKPITVKAALEAYGQKLPELEIKMQFGSVTEEKHDVQCPQCQNIHTISESSYILR